VILGVFCAMAIVVMLLSKVMPPVSGFLQFDFKDVVIAVGGFLFGPISAVCISVVVSLIEMLMPSSSGPVGMLMNVLATCTFVCPAAFLYQRRHTFKSAVVGIVFGCILMTGTMLLWNFLITPLYLGVERSAVVAMIIPILLPFNLLKAGMNAALTILLYKPVVTALRKARLVAEQRYDGEAAGVNWGAIMISAALLATFILLGLVMAGKL